MDFLFDNPLADLYGPYFLILYGFIIVASIIGYRVFKNRLDRSEQLGVPPIPNNPDAFEISYLRGGENELARTVVFALAQKNLLKFVNDDQLHQVQPTGIEFNKRDLSPIENTALDWFKYARDTKEMFQTNGLADALHPYVETYRRRIESQNFIVDDAMQNQNSRLVVSTFLVFAAVGAYKFLVAVYFGHWNVFGIVAVTIAGTVILGIAGKMPRLTKRGQSYLKRLQLAFERIKPSNHNSTLGIGSTPSATFASVDPFLLSVGVFGGAALAGTMYSDYNRTFEKAQSQTGGGSCGSGCGSSCSSGGGSSCGGGCGGCGGGCGG